MTNRELFHASVALIVIVASIMIAYNSDRAGEKSYVKWSFLALAIAETAHLLHIIINSNI